MSRSQIQIVSFVALLLVLLAGMIWAVKDKVSPAVLLVFSLVGTVAIGIHLYRLRRDST